MFRYLYQIFFFFCSLTLLKRKVLYCHCWFHQENLTFKQTFHSAKGPLWWKKGFKMEEHLKKVILRKWFPNGVTEKITVWNFHFFKVFTGICACGSMKILSIFVMYGTFQLHKRFYRGKRFFRLLKHSFKN